MKSFFCALGVLIPFFAFAAAPATIITRVGVATPPIKYYFDLSSALSEGVNQGVRVIVSASNAEKTAVHFDSVKLFDKSGATVGNNVASKTDALTGIPYGFSFSNFGVAPADLANVAGVQITFMDLGGENSTGKVTVQSVAVSVTRDSGEACVIADPITIVLPPPPPPTIVSIQRARPLVQPGTHGTGDSGSGGGGSTSMGPYYPSAASSGGSPVWGSTSNIYSDNDLVTATIMPPNTMLGGSLTVTGFSFSIPVGATVDGIEVNLERRQTGVATGIADHSMYLWKNGTLGMNSLSTASPWPTSFVVKTFGGPTNKWGETSLTPDMVNSAGFGFVQAVSNSHASSALTAEIDYGTMTVYYTPLGGSVYDSFMDLIRSFFRVLKK